MLNGLQNRKILIKKNIRMEYGNITEGRQAIYKSMNVMDLLDRGNINKWLKKS